MDRELMVTVKEEGEHIQSELLHMRNTWHAAQGYGRVKGFSPWFLDTVRITAQVATKAPRPACLACARAMAGRHKGYI